MNKQERTVSILNIVIIGLFFILLVGTPLLFTSYTRSVFEVNKLLLLRIIIILTYGVWLLRALYQKHNFPRLEKDKTYTILGFQWKKIGLEIPILILLITNILSTIFSQNIKISIIGAYDRWEGIITISNYLMLYLMFAKNITQRTYLYWIMAGLVIPAGLSAIYGIYQSVGWDFMHWSVDPTARVFACINNPVHFCAYVAMIVPIGLGWLLYYSSKEHHFQIDPDKKAYPLIKWGMFISSLCILHIPSTVFNSINTIKYFDLNPIINISNIFLQGIWQLISQSILHLFTQPNIPLIGLCLIAWVLSLTTTILIPNKDFLLKWGCYFLLLAFLYSVNLVSFSSELWVSFLIMLMSYFILSPFPNINLLAKRGILIFTALVFYAVFLSFSRATWIGFMGAGSLFYLLVTGNLSLKTKKTLHIDFFLTILGLGCFFLYTIFHIELVNLFAGVFIFAILLLYVIYSYILCNEKTSFKELTRYDYKKLLLYIGLILATFIIDISSLVPPLVSLIYTLTMGFLFLWICSNAPHKKFLERFIIIIVFVNIQSIIVSPISIINYIVLLYGFYLVSLKKSSLLPTELKFWLLSLLFIFGLSFSLPSIPHYIATFSNQTTTSNSLESLKLAKFRASSYKNEAQNGTPRGSMWKSSIPWIKDHFLIGSGLDTVKYMYPVYRRSEYGILEGGHNFTPDRLHNEYLNTFATKGIIGFVAFYIAFILPWYFMMLNGFYRFRHHRFRFLVAAFISGCSIYLGQTIFNFGVVATLVLFYTLMAAGHALVTHPKFIQDAEKENAEEKKEMEDNK